MIEEDKHLPIDGDGEKKKLEPVGQGKMMGPSMGKRVVEAFLGDSLENIGKDILRNARNTAKDFVYSGLMRSLNDVFYHGQARSEYRSRGNSGSQFRKNNTAYNKVYEDRNGLKRLSHDERVRQDFQNVIFDTMPQATEALREMQDRARVYGQTTVGDLYSLAGFDSDYTDEKFGWRDDDLKFVNIRRNSSADGYYLDLKKPIDLSR